MRTLKSREIIKSIAEREGLTREQVWEILVSYFDFVKHAQANLLDREKNFFPTIRLPNFGVFYIPERTQERLAKHNKQQKNETD